jgi:hypothetical protein
MGTRVQSESIWRWFKKKETQVKYLASPDTGGGGEQPLVAPSVTATRREAVIPKAPLMSFGSFLLHFFSFKTLPFGGQL